MPLKVYRIPKRVGTYSARVRKEAVEVEERAEATARATLYLAQLAHTMHEQGMSYRKIARLLDQEPFRTHAGGLTVSAPWLHALARRYAAGQVSLHDYYPKPRGRRTAYVRTKVLEQARTLVLGRYRHAPMAEAWRELNGWIEEEKLGDPLGYDQFKGMVHRIGRGPRTGAGFGSRAGELFGTFHATVACAFTHDIWTCDAFDAPWINRVLIPEHGIWVFIRPSIIVVEDYKSGATIGYWVSDPSRRRTDKGEIATTGFDKDDVIAALLCAAMSELATPATVGLGGRLCRQIRWDRHQVNEHLRRILQEVAAELMIEGDSFFGEDEQPEVTEIVHADGRVEHTLIDNPKLPPRRPKNRGRVEGTNRILADMCAGMRGHLDFEVPAPMWNDETWKRTTGAAIGLVAPQRIPVAIENVPLLEESREEFDRVVDRRNNLRNRRTGDTPRVRHARFMPPRARRGDDLLAVLETRSAFVGSHGIEVFHDDISTLFEPVITGAGMRYELDAQVTFKVDPFYRYLFVRPKGEARTYLLPPKDTYWSDEDAATRAARQQSAAARAASDEGKAIQRREHDAMYGPGAAERGEEQARAYEEHRKAMEAVREQAGAEGQSSAGSPHDTAQGAPTGPAVEHGAGAAPLRPVDVDASTAPAATSVPSLTTSVKVDPTTPVVLDGPPEPHLVTHTPDSRPQASRRIAQSRASVTKKAEHEAEVTGRYRRVTQLPTHAPPAPVDPTADAQDEPTPEAKPVGSPADPTIAPSAPSSNAEPTEAAETPVLPVPPITALDLTLDLSAAFGDQYRPKSPRED